MSTEKAKRPKKAVALLNLTQRTKLTALLNDPIVQAALGNAAAAKPGVFFLGAGASIGNAKDSSMATLAANNRLHEIRGWEMFETALFAQTEDPKVARAQLSETYPDEGAKIE